MRANAIGEEDLTKEAYATLDRTQEFSPQEFANSRCSSHDWKLLASLYKAAVTLCLISLLQSVSIVPVDSPLMSRRHTLSRSLHHLLGDALLCTPIKLFVPWPLVVLGVKVANGRANMRSFVEKRLPDMSRHMGLYRPLTALAVL